MATSNALSHPPSTEQTTASTAKDESRASFQSLMDRPRQTPWPDAGSVVLGTLMSFDSHGHPQVNWPGRTASSTTQATLARSLVALAPEHLGKTIALSFPSGSVQPLILGVVWQPSVPEVTKYQSIQAELDGEIVSLQDHDQHVHKNNLHHLELEGQESVTLRCGKASITLTADGQILLRAAYISSHSSGTQRIKGAAVRIN